MKLTILGSCSGTEPMPGRHHTCLAVERAGAVYFVDAGEGCSHTAHVRGIDLLATRAVFISHPHIDHVGGLPNLLWTMHKLNGRTTGDPRPLTGKTLPLYLPDLAAWEGARRFLEAVCGSFGSDFQVRPCAYGDGKIYDDGHLAVTALHNAHLGTPAGGPWRSFSFRIAAGPRSVVYSGDVASPAELEGLLADRADVLLMETGHHNVADVCRHFAGAGRPFDRLVFVHHGRAILADPDGQRRLAREILGPVVEVADDGLCIEL